ncbi:uncharacterized protein [Euphorbia lathyris]|uniref:uncharacterized protein n=1 Tax=Euphorbia lathyris TaxID=212925 RepID=UPI003313263C
MDVVNFRRDDLGNNEGSYKKNYEIVLSNPVVLNSEENRGESRNDGKRIRYPMDEETTGNLSDSEVINSGEIGGVREKNKDIGIKIDELSDQETCARENGESLSRVEQNSVDKGVFETKILVNDSEENHQSNHEGTLRLDKPMMKNVCEKKKQTCVIDVRCGNGGVKDCDGERVCRICQLNSEGLAETKATNSSMELIQLGCGCKDELGISHAYCAEAWFKLKGNRICEICGEMARNITVTTGMGDNRFMDEWNERRYVGSSISIPPDGSNGCWRGQPLCNFLMACLVVAFVLPWFFRGNMF